MNIHIHRYYCNTCQYDYRIHKNKITFKCICGKEITNNFLKTIQIIKWKYLDNLKKANLIE